MDLEEIEVTSNLCKNTMNKFLNAERIEDNHLMEAAQVLRLYDRTQLDTDTINIFLSDVSLFFSCLNKYAKQEGNIDTLKEYMFRKAIGTFLMLVATIESYINVAAELVAVFDVSLEHTPQFNVKEHLRMYSFLLEPIPEASRILLLSVHQPFTYLYDFIKTTGDLEFQMLIVDMLFKLCPNSEDELQMLPDDMKRKLYPSDVDHIYKKLRVILNGVNTNFYDQNIFSINCSSIKVNSHLIQEYEGADPARGIWLDFDLRKHRLSFFCEKNILKTIRENFFNNSAWEVIAFAAKDILETRFEYDRREETLHIFLSFKSSSCSILYIESDPDQIQNVEITVFKHTENFDKFMEEVLPDLFPALVETLSAVMVQVRNEAVSIIDLVSSDSVIVLSDTEVPPIQYKIIGPVIEVRDSDYSESGAYVIRDSEDNDNAEPLNLVLRDSATTFSYPSTSGCNKSLSQASGQSDTNSEDRSSVPKENREYISDSDESSDQASVYSDRNDDESKVPEIREFISDSDKSSERSYSVDSDSSSDNDSVSPDENRESISDRNLDQTLQLEADDVVLDENRESISESDKSLDQVSLHSEANSDDDAKLLDENRETISDSDKSLDQVSLHSDANSGEGAGVPDENPESISDRDESLDQVSLHSDANSGEGAGVPDENPESISDRDESLYQVSLRSDANFGEGAGVPDENPESISDRDEILYEPFVLGSEVTVPFAEAELSTSASEDENLLDNPSSSTQVPEKLFEEDTHHFVKYLESKEDAGKHIEDSAGLSSPTINQGVIPASETRSKRLRSPTTEPDQEKEPRQKKKRKEEPVPECPPEGAAQPSTSEERPMEDVASTSKSQEATPPKSKRRKGRKGKKKSKGHKNRN